LIEALRILEGELSRIGRYETDYENRIKSLEDEITNYRIDLKVLQSRRKSIEELIERVTDGND
jgi:predicted  nucleic acid-binding Zn-ribbon protein